MAVACSPPKAQIPLFHQCTALLAACCCNLYNLYTSKQFQSPLCFVAGVIHTTHFWNLYHIMKFEESILFFRRMERSTRDSNFFTTFNALFLTLWYSKPLVWSSHLSGLSVLGNIRHCRLNSKPFPIYDCLLYDFVVWQSKYSLPDYETKVDIETKYLSNKLNIFTG